MRRMALLLPAMTILACALDSTGSSCDGFFLSPNAPTTLSVGDSVRLSPERKGIDVEFGGCNTVEDSPTAYTWTSSTPQVASVDSLAVVRALAPGHATITAAGRPGASAADCAEPWSLA